MMTNSDPEGQIFISAPNNYDRFFFLQNFLPPAFGFNIGVAINESRSNMLMSTVLKADFVCDVVMTSTPNVFMTALRDLLYNQCMKDMCCYCLFI